ncbi:MAG: hypothetical protein D6679_13790, partial [Candidatus Hydrogenedentota bacterium]
KARRDDAIIRGGGEYWVGKVLALRLGYDGSVTGVDNGLTGGLGIRWEEFSLDYAFMPFGEIGENHRFGIGYRWGP